MILNNILLNDSEAQDILAWAFITKESCTAALASTPNSEDTDRLTLSERIHNAEMVASKISDAFPDLQKL